MLSSTACPDNSGKSRHAGKTFLQSLFFFLLITQICFGQWYAQNSNTLKNIRALYFTDEDNGWAVGDSGLIIHTTNGGQDWIGQTSGTMSPLNDIYFTNPNTGFAVGGSLQNPNIQGAFLRTTNSGLDWIPNEGEGLEGIALNSLSFLDSINGWAVGSFASSIGELGIIFRCDYGFIRWDGSTISADFCFTDVCFIGTENVTVIGNYSRGIGWVSGYTIIMRTTDLGSSWTSQIDDLNSIFFIDSNNGWGVGQYGMFPRMVQILRTTDGGENWFRQLNQQTTMEVYYNGIYFSDLNNGWVVGDAGTIIHSFDSGTTWIPQQSGTTNKLNNVFFVDFNNGWIVGENGTILHTSNGGLTFIEDNLNSQPSEYSLSQSYPNPFNSSSVIKYSIPKSSQVTLKIFNTLGEEIETLVNEEKTVGIYEVNWNAENLPSGVYFYMLQAGDFIQTRKMILLK